MSKLTDNRVGKCRHCGDEFQITSYRRDYCDSSCAYNEIIKRGMEKVSMRRFRIFMRDDFKCFYCGKTSAEHDARLVLDHVVPRAASGGDSADNLVSCCTECNMTKKAIIMSDEQLEWIRSIIIPKNRLMSLK